jgi:hypothetical protein
MTLESLNNILLITILSLTSVVASGEVISFGQSNAKGIVIYGGESVVDCAKGGQKIKAFLPTYDIRTLYGDCIRKMGGKKATAIIFWQGESDTGRASDARNWSLRSSLVIRSLLQDVGTPATKVVLVVINNRADPKLFPYWQQIRNIQLNSPFILIDSSLYPFEPSIGSITSPIHLTKAGYRAITRDIFLKLR